AVPARRQQQLFRQRRLHQQHRCRETVLSLAALRDRARLQHLEHDGKPAASGGDRGVPKRTLSVIGLAAMNRTIKISRYMRRAAGDFAADRRALAAVEFAFILPLMLVLFFGTI